MDINKLLVVNELRLYDGMVRCYKYINIIYNEKVIEMIILQPAFSIKMDNLCTRVHQSECKFIVFYQPKTICLSKLFYKNLCVEKQ